MTEPFAIGLTHVSALLQMLRSYNSHIDTWHHHDDSFAQMSKSYQQHVY
jgi:hypothetical protein